MQYTQFVVLSLGLLVVCLIRGDYPGLGQVTLPVILAIVCERLIVLCRGSRQSASTGHSILLAIILWGMLEHDQWLISCFAVALALLWKHLWGGLGNYICHPALVAIAVIELILKFSDYKPLAAALHNYGRIQMAEITIVDGVPALAEFFADKTPGIIACLTGQVGGAMAFCPAVFVPICVYLVYRGYMNWRLPLVFLASATLAAILLPLPISGHYYFLPACSQGVDVLITWLFYNLLTGPLVFAAAILFLDSTSRPIKLSGQVIFAFCAGLMVVVLRFYSPLLYPEAVAIAIIGVFVPVIDCFTRRMSK